MQILNQASLAKISILEKTFIVILCIVFIVNLMKPLMDFYFGIEHTSLTIFQFFILFLFYFIKKTKSLTFSHLEWSFLFFLLMRYLVEIFTFEVGFFQPTSSLMLFIILILGVNFFVNYKHGEIFYHKLNGILWIYFILTIIISVLQLTNSHVGGIFANYGGNRMSGNIYGITRCTGGIGGTVVDYAMLIIFYTLLYTTYKHKGIKNIIYLFSLIIASILVFSRVVFLVFLILLTLYILQNMLTVKKTRSFVVITTFTILIVTLMNVYYDEFKVFLYYDSYSKTSDEERMIQWENVIEELGNTSYIIGHSMGRNTGVTSETVGRKIVADGHFQGFLSDYGIVGLCLYVMYLLCSVYKAVNKKIEGILFILILFTSLIINSGFEKFFNIYVFPIILFIVRQNFLMREKENYLQSALSS